MHGVRHLEHHHQEKRDDRRCNRETTSARRKKKTIETKRAIESTSGVPFERNPRRGDAPVTRDAGLTFCTHMPDNSPPARAAAAGMGQGSGRFIAINLHVNNKISRRILSKKKFCLFLSLSLALPTACCPSDLDESRIVRQHIAQGKDDVLVGQQHAYHRLPTKQHTDGTAASGEDAHAVKLLPDELRSRRRFLGEGGGKTTVFLETDRPPDRCS